MHMIRLCYPFFYLIPISTTFLIIWYTAIPESIGVAHTVALVGGVSLSLTAYLIEQFEAENKFLAACMFILLALPISYFIIHPFNLSIMQEGFNYEEAEFQTLKTVGLIFLVSMMVLLARLLHRS